MERNAIYLYKAGTMGAGVLQKEMRCMQWKGAGDPIGNRGECQSIHSNLAEQSPHNDRVTRLDLPMRTLRDLISSFARLIKLRY